jgi:prophage antirepressor-like protein
LRRSAPGSELWPRSRASKTSAAAFVSLGPDTYGVDSDVIGFPNVFPESIPPQFQEKIRDGGLPVWWHRFSGQGQRPTPVTSPKGVLEILALLPGRAPAAIRRAAFDTLARVLGGDASLVDDVLKMRRVQEVLGETDSSSRTAVVSTAQGSMSFECGVLRLNGEPVSMHFFADAPDEPWIQAKPVHNFLGAGNICQTVARVHADDKMSLKDLLEHKGQPVGGSGTPPGGMRDIPPVESISHNDGKSIYVNESGFYKILLGSQKPEAERLQRWVTKDVLPSIRRTGAYTVPTNGGLAEIRLAKEECVVACELAARTTRGVLNEAKAFIQLKDEAAVAELETARERARIEEEAAESAHRRRLDRLAEEARANDEESRRRVDRIRDEAKAQAAFNRTDTRKKNHELRYRERMIELGHAHPQAGQPPSALLPEPRAPPRRPRRTAGLPIRVEEDLESLRSAPVPPGRADDPDLEAYRNAGIPDDALPVSAEEAERWRVLAAKWKQRAIQFRTGRVIFLVPRGSVGYDGEPSRPTQWEPVARALAV